MILQNLHTHTVFDDGADTPMEMARAALGAGLTSLGFSCHAVLPYDNDWCITEKTLPDYLTAVDETKAAFHGRLSVYSGIEWDGVSPQSTADFDYVIGSLHHIVIGDETPSIDDTAAVTKDALARFWGGNESAMAEAYFAQYEALAQNPAVDIVGHFDLLGKFRETDGLFPENAAFLDSAIPAMEALLRADKIFEVNTGAMCRGYRAEPYPSVNLLRELNARHGRVLLASDAHSAKSIAYGFRETEALLKEIGFRESWIYSGSGFVPVAL